MRAVTTRLQTPVGGAAGGVDARRNVADEPWVRTKETARKGWM